MSSDSNRLDVESLLAGIRQGKREQLGELLELYRNYLLILARTQIDLHLRGRLSAADVVQESYLEACCDFAQFRGNTGAELLTWLRRILIHNLASAVEQHIKTQKRDARREVPIRSYLDCLEQSSAGLDAALVSHWTTPSSAAQQNEAKLILANQMARLPAHYRDVLVLRNLEGLSFAEVAQHMGRTVRSVRMLWIRALNRLREHLQDDHLI